MLCKIIHPSSVLRVAWACRSPSSLSHSQTHSDGQFRVPSWPRMHVLGPQEEAREPGGIPHRHRESMQGPLDWTQNVTEMRKSFIPFACSTVQKLRTKAKTKSAFCDVTKGTIAQ